MLLTASAGSVVLLFTLCGCSGDGKSYAVPEKICGVPVQEDALRDLLPTGAELKTEESHTSGIPERRHCGVLVDGNVELTSEGVWRKDGFTAEDAAKDTLAFNTESRRGGVLQVWKDGATTVFDCGNPKQKAERFSIELKVVRPDGDMSGELERYLVSYMKAYQKVLPCEA